MSNFLNCQGLKFTCRNLLIGLVTLFLTSACGSMRSYDTELKQTVGMAASGRVGEALQELEKNNTGADKDILYSMEKGELLKLTGQINESRNAWLMADEKVKIWESEVKTDPAKFIGNVASVIVNDKSRRYDGQDYEKVMLSTKLALDHLLIGDWDSARIEIKKTHEREAIIAELRSKEIEKVEEESKNRKVSTEFKDLKGYPVETLNDPDVTSLKNSYQSAFGHYLAGFVYESLGEPSLAAPGYRKAIELRPDIKWLEEGLKKLDTRASKLKRKETDVLFVVELGSIPARESVSLPIPIPYKNTLLAVPISFPVIRADKSCFLPQEITVGDRPAISVYPVTSLDAMARRALKDDMPGIILRGTVRAITKTVAQKEVSDRNALAGLAMTIAAVATESADERIWRTLPSQILLGRATLPTGQHTIKIAGPSGIQSATVDVAGKHALIAMRMLGGNLYLTQPVYSQQMLDAATAMPDTPGSNTGTGSKTSPAKKSKKTSRNQ